MRDLKCRLIVILLLFVSVLVKAQTRNTDSLRQLLGRQVSDSGQAHVMLSLGWELKTTNPDSGQLLINRADKLFEQGRGMDKFSREFGHYKVYHFKGLYSYIMGNYDTAESYYLKALKGFENLENKQDKNSRLCNITLERRSVILGNLAVLYASQGDNYKALEIFENALQIDRKRGDSIGIAKNLGNMGLVYARIGNHSQALDFYLRSLQINKNKGNIEGEAGNLIAIAGIYKDRDENAKALDYLFTVVNIADKRENSHLKATAYGEIGNV